MRKNIYYFHPSIFFFFLIFSFFLISPSLLAFDITSTESITVSAKVGDDITPPITPGGGGGISIPKTSVLFSGEAYPNAAITVLKNGENTTTVNADNEGTFNITLEEKYNSTTLYSLFAKDIAGIRSLLINYPIVVSAGYLTHLSGIRFPPTVTLDKVEVREGDYLTVIGYALPKKELQVIIEDKNKISTVFSLTSTNTGYYKTILPLINIPQGDYFIYVKYTGDDRKSVLNNFTIGETNVSSVDTSLNIPGDYNSDGIVNLADFSVLAFWYKKSNPPANVDINKDGVVDLKDFSILAFHWIY
jgi:hypothetical protein